MPHTRILPSFTFIEERLAQLRMVVPEGFADGRINWTALREALGDDLEDEGSEAEHFGLFWPGKRAARRLASIPSRGTLVPKPGEGVNEDTTRNVFLEGENLEVLKLIQKAYAGRVKAIYIDPPYNTGNDLVYHDDYTDPLGEYLRKTGQSDDEGIPLTTNTRADGRFHSNWLSMMYPRLRLMRTLLSDEGVIFVSIDDNEVAQLRMMLNEIFGDEAFIAQLVWRSRVSEDTRATTGVSTDHEYILCYRKTEEAVLRGSDKDLTKFANPDNDSRGPWRSADLTGLATIDRRPNLHYDLVNPDTKIKYECPAKGWRFERSTMAKKISEGRVLWPKEPSGRPRHKLFLKEMKSSFKNMSSLVTAYSTLDGTREINELLGNGVFDFPKPSGLIKELIRQTTQPGDLVADFFAGSGPTGQAVLEAAAADHQVSFLLVQMPEPYHRGRYKTVAEIARARLRSVIKKLPKAARQSSGFRCFALQPSHLSGWEDYRGKDADELQIAFDNAADVVVANADAGGLRAEIMLLEGFPLDSSVTALPSIKTNKIVSITSEYCGHRLLTSFDKRINESTVPALDLQADDVFVCLDSALTDEQKLRLADRCNLKTI